MDYLSSPMRWCEYNLGAYKYSNYIVEFENSISSLCFCIFAVYGAYKHYKYISNNEIWVLMSLIGITSFWFHATLSSSGQFADEISIVLMTSYCLIILLIDYVVQKHYSFEFKALYINAWIILTPSSMFVCWAYPSYSPFILLIEGCILSIPLICFVDIPIIKMQIIMQAAIFAGIGIIWWALDFYCLFNAHFFWHIFISYSSYLFALSVLRSNTQLYFVNAFIPYWRIVNYETEQTPIQPPMQTPMQRCIMTTV